MVIRPGSKLEGAVLLIEREMLHLNLAGTLVDYRWKPRNTTVERDDYIRKDSHLIGTVSTADVGGKGEIYKDNYADG